MLFRHNQCRHKTRVNSVYFLYFVFMAKKYLCVFFLRIFGRSGWAVATGRGPLSTVGMRCKRNPICGEVCETEIKKYHVFKEDG